MLQNENIQSSNLRGTYNSLSLVEIGCSGHIKLRLKNW